MKIFQLLSISWNLYNCYKHHTKPEYFERSIIWNLYYRKPATKIFWCWHNRWGEQYGTIPSPSDSFHKFEDFYENPRLLLQPFKAFTSCIQRRNILVSSRFTSVLCLHLVLCPSLLCWFQVTREIYFHVSFLNILQPRSSTESFKFHAFQNLTSF
jgi:hypothetical protein